MYFSLDFHILDTRVFPCFNILVQSTKEVGLRCFNTLIFRLNFFSCFYSMWSIFWDEKMNEKIFAWSYTRLSWICFVHLRPIGQKYERKLIKTLYHLLFVSLIFDVLIGFNSVRFWKVSAKIHENLVSVVVTYRIICPNFHFPSNSL